jgi:hypothetical protein
MNVRAPARGSVLPLLNRSDAVRRGLPCEHGYGGGRGGHDLLLLRFNAETIPNAVHGHRKGGTAPRGRTFDRRSGRSGRDLVRGAEQRHRKDGPDGPMVGRHRAWHVHRYRAQPQVQQRSRRLCCAQSSHGGARGRHDYSGPLRWEVVARTAAWSDATSDQRHERIWPGIVWHAEQREQRVR